MIVRIFSDGQYRIPRDTQARLREIDAQTEEAIDADDDLVPSDLMLPPADITLEEARSEFTGEGLLPD